MKTIELGDIVVLTKNSSGYIWRADCDLKMTITGVAPQDMNSVNRIHKGDILNYKEVEDDFSHKTNWCILHTEIDEEKTKLYRKEYE